MTLTKPNVDGGTSRRTFIRGVGAATVGATALSKSQPVTAQSDFEAWFENVSNYNGVVDETGTSEVTVMVGAEANGGGFGFNPAAVRISPGTTVVWEWTGAGGSHDVNAEDNSFASEMQDSEGATFKHTFEEEGVYKYACTPHKTMGMKGAIVVGDVEVGASQSKESEATPSEVTNETSGHHSEQHTAHHSEDDDDGMLVLVGLLAGVLLSGLFALPLSELWKKNQQSNTQKQGHRKNTGRR